MTNEKAKEIIYNKTPISQIIDVWNFGDCVEVTGRAGRDVLTYRVYEDGTICER